MPWLEKSITTVSQRLLGLDPGSLAELRRMRPDGIGTPIFWRLAVELDFREDQTKEWMQIFSIFAILTPKSHLNPVVRLHDGSRKLGRVFCDGGNPAWPPDPQHPRPVLSEQRLARLFATPAAQRGEAIERIARMLSRSRTPESGINCTEIARLLLDPTDQKSIHSIAQAYYHRFDRAARNSKDVYINKY
jgi:CRISPR system Cascade subunit CasB